MAVCNSSPNKLLSVMLKIILALFCLLQLASVSNAQKKVRSALPEFNQQRLKITRSGLTVLGSWGLANVITGAIGQSSSSGSTKYFHRMNLYVGAVNTGLSVIGILASRGEETNLEAATSFKRQLSAERLFLFNSGLDIAYVVGGIYLTERSRRSLQPNRLLGYGRSVILQGAGLALFDGLMYYVHAKHGKALLQHVRLSVSAGSVDILVRR